MGEDSNSGKMLTIGRLARAGGVGVTTVRYYQRRGLLQEPDKPATGKFRAYSERDLERLLLIKHSKELGFTLAEISQLLDHAESNNCHAVRGLAEKKLESVKTQIRLLNTRRRALKTMLAECKQGCSALCPIHKKIITTRR